MNTSRFFTKVLILLLAPIIVRSQENHRIHLTDKDVNFGDTLVLYHDFLTPSCSYFEYFQSNLPPFGDSDFGVEWNLLNGGVDFTLYYLPQTPGITMLDFKGTAYLHQHYKACYDYYIEIIGKFNVHYNSNKLFFQKNTIINAILDTARELISAKGTFLAHNTTNDTIHIDSILFNRPTDQYNYFSLDTSTSTISPAYIIPSKDWVDIPFTFTTDSVKTGDLQAYIYTSNKTVLRLDTLSIPIYSAYIYKPVYCNVNEIKLMIVPENHFDTSFIVVQNKIAKIFGMSASSPSIKILSIDSLNSSYKVHIRVTAKDSTFQQEDMQFNLKYSLSLKGNPNFEIDSIILPITYQVPFNNVAQRPDINEQVDIFPNPASSSVNIFNRNNTSISITSIQLFNTLGLEVLSINSAISLIPAESYQFLTDKLTKGEYIVKIYTSAETITKKLLLIK